MENYPLISIIVPVYNVEKYVTRCLESIINQTYSDLEIIIVDDGSTDHSYEICREFAEKDQRIILLHKENGGLASARNYGLAHTHGGYIGFIDSDDWIEENSCEELLRAAQRHPGYVAMCGRYNVHEETGEKIPVFCLPGEMVWEREEVLRRFLISDKLDTAVCDKLFPSELIHGREFPSGLISEDMLFTYGTLKSAEGIVHIGAAKYNYLQRTGSITHTFHYTDSARGMYVYPEQIYQDVCANYPKLKKEASHYYFSRMIRYLQLCYSSGMTDQMQVKAVQLHMGEIMASPYFSKAEKIKFMLTACNMLGLGMRVKAWLGLS